MRFKFLIASICLLIALSAQTQNKQYYVDFRGDTIYGKINSNLSRDNSRQILFKTTNGEKRTLTPNSTRAVYFNKKNVFKPVIHNDSRYFMVEHYSGRLSSYTYTRFEPNSGSVISSKIVTKEGDKSYEITAFNFKRTILEVVSDCQSVANMILENDLRYGHLIKIGSMYEKCEPVVKEMEIKGAKPDISTEMIQKDLQSVYLEIEASDLDTKDQTLEILTDIKNRIDKGESIPGYVWEALFDKVQDEPEFERKLREIKNKIAN